MRFTRILMVSAAMTLAAGNVQAQTNTAINGATDCVQSEKAGFVAANANCTRTTTVDVVVPYLAASRVDAVNSITITNADMNAGTREWTGPVVEMQANFDYQITAHISGFGATKAASDLQIKNITDNTAFSPFGANNFAVTLRTGAATANYKFTSGLKLALNWASDEPGTLSTNITYTVVAQ